MAKKKECKVVSTPQMIIKKQLLASLTDEGKVALILDLKDLHALIHALEATNKINDPNELLKDLKQLRRLAFPEFSRGSKK